VGLGFFFWSSQYNPRSPSCILDFTDKYSDITLLNKHKGEINALFTAKDMGLGDKTFHPYHPEEGNRHPPKILTGDILCQNKYT